MIYFSHLQYWLQLPNMFFRIQWKAKQSFEKIVVSHTWMNANVVPFMLVKLDAAKLWERIEVSAALWCLRTSTDNSVFPITFICVTENSQQFIGFSSKVLLYVPWIMQTKEERIFLVERRCVWNILTAVWTSLNLYPPKNISIMTN